MRVRTRSSSGRSPSSSPPAIPSEPFAGAKTPFRSTRTVRASCPRRRRGLAIVRGMYSRGPGMVKLPQHVRGRGRRAKVAPRWRSRSSRPTWRRWRRDSRRCARAAAESSSRTDASISSIPGTSVTWRRRARSATPSCWDSTATRPSRGSRVRNARSSAVSSGPRCSPGSRPSIT